MIKSIGMPSYGEMAARLTLKGIDFKPSTESATKVISFVNSDGSKVSMHFDEIGRQALTSSSISRGDVRTSKDYTPEGTALFIDKYVNGARRENWVIDKDEQGNIWAIGLIKRLLNGKEVKSIPFYRGEVFSKDLFWRY